MSYQPQGNYKVYSWRQLYSWWKDTKTLGKVLIVSDGSGAKKSMFFGVYYKSIMLLSKLL
jgi:hypothetical protein